MTRPIRVLAVSDPDGFPLPRYGHEIDAAIRVVGSAATTRQALRILTEQAVDVIVIDAHLRNARAAFVFGELQRMHPEAAFVVVMAAQDGEIAGDLAARGVQTIVLDSVSPAELALSIRSARAGRSMISPILLTAVLEILRSPEQPQSLRPPLDRLTSREVEVLQHMVGGAGRKDIAEILHVSVNTVRTHVQNVLRKLGVNSSLQAVSVAIRAGFRAPSNGAPPHPMS